MLTPQKTLEDLYKDAKKCPVKGRLYMYERYKCKLLEMNLSSDEYTEACRKLATYLGV